MADSRSLVGGMPVAWISASWVSLQLLFVIVANAPGPCSSSTGSARTSAGSIPARVNVGPIARSSTCFGPLPVMMNPPMPYRALSENTFKRVERLTALPGGIAPGVGVGDSAAVALGVAVGAMLALGVAVGTIVALGVAVGAMLALGVAVGAIVALALAVAVGVGVGVDPPPQLPLTLNTRCMFGNPIAAVVVGVVIPQPVALR